MDKKFTGKLLCFVMICMLLAGCKGDLEEKEAGTTFIYAENQAESYPTSMGAYKFAELVSERTGGKIEIRVQTGGVLGDEGSVLEQLQLGGVDFARVSLSPLAELIPRLNVLQMPYLYEDSEQMWKVLDGEIGQDFLDSFEESGMIALSWYDAGARSFYNSKSEIKTPEDIKGMRIRIQESNLMMDMIEALGALPVPMPYGEVYSGLQTRRIDGAENNWASYESTGHYQVAPYYTVNEHTRVPELQLVSGQAWDKLSKEDQKIITECARESAEYERGIWAETEAKAKAKIKQKGGMITELNSQERKKFKEAMEPLYEKYCNEYTEIIRAIQGTR